jgi:magnesium transporter
MTHRAEKEPMISREASRSDAGGGIDAHSGAFKGTHLASGSNGTVRVAAWDGSRLEEWSGPTALEQLPGLRTRPDVALWIDYTAPNPDQVAALGPILDLHPLIVEDIVEGNQRSKFEATDGLIHIVMFALEYDEGVVSSEIDMVLGLGFLLTVHEAHWDPRAAVHLRGGIAPILKRGPDHLLWAMSDSIVDGYFPFADRLGDAIEEIQDEVIVRANRASLERLIRLKRDLIGVRRAAAPVREIFAQLTNRDLTMIDPEEILYFRDVYDHVIRLTDELDTYREMASGTLEVYLSTVNNNLSLIMKRLTGVTVILAGVGAVAGIFGMSEASTALAGGEGTGFWLVSGLMVAGAAGVAALLRRFDWI